MGSGQPLRSVQLSHAAHSTHPTDIHIHTPWDLHALTHVRMHRCTHGLHQDLVQKLTIRLLRLLHTVYSLHNQGRAGTHVGL